MNKNDSIVKFNDDDLNIIKENIHSIYNKVLNTRLKQMFTRNVYKIIAYIILTLGLLAIIIAITTLLLTKVSKTFYLVLIIIGIILVLFAILLVTVRQVFLKKIKQEFLKHNIHNLKMAVNVTFKEVEISNVSNKFTIMPQKFLIIGSNFNHRVYTEKVIIGNINDKRFNCGTMLEKIIKTYKTGKTTTTTIPIIDIFILPA